MLLANLFRSLFYTSARFLSCNKSPSLARPEVFHLILEKVCKVLYGRFCLDWSLIQLAKAPSQGQFGGREQQRRPTASATVGFLFYFSTVLTVVKKTQNITNTRFNLEICVKKKAEVLLGKAEPVGLCCHWRKQCQRIKRYVNERKGKRKSEGWGELSHPVTEQICLRLLSSPQSAAGSSPPSCSRFASTTYLQLKRGLAA